MASQIRSLTTLIVRAAARDLDQRLTAQGAVVTGLRYSVLRLLADQPRTISELSRSLLLSATTLVPVVDALERAGFMVREKDRKDGRRSPLVLTTQGQEMVARISLVDDDDALRQSIERLGAAKSQQLVTLLQELALLLSADEKLVNEPTSVAGPLDVQPQD